LEVLQERLGEKAAERERVLGLWETICVASA
jgi:hypothetical protein